MLRYDGFPLAIHCQSVTLRFKPNTGQSAVELRSVDVGGTDYLEVWRETDELRIGYVRLQNKVPVYQEVLCYNFDSVNSYACEKLRVDLVLITNPEEVQARK